jgi:hypothetical protein
MDKAELARKMLAWGSMSTELEVLEEEISRAVLAMGESVTNGNVRATYSGVVAPMTIRPPSSPNT